MEKSSSILVLRIIVGLKRIIKESFVHRRRMVKSIYVIKNRIIKAILFWNVTESKKKYFPIKKLLDKVAKNCLLRSVVFSSTEFDPFLLIFNFQIKTNIDQSYVYRYGLRFYLYLPCYNTYLTLLTMDFRIIFAALVFFQLRKTRIF